MAYDLEKTQEYAYFEQLDDLAKAAMTGLLANPNTTTPRIADREHVSVRAYEMAYAMMAQGHKEQAKFYQKEKTDVSEIFSSSQRETRDE